MIVPQDDELHGTAETIFYVVQRSVQGPYDLKPMWRNETSYVDSKGCPLGGPWTSQHEARRAINNARRAHARAYRVPPQWRIVKRTITNEVVWKALSRDSRDVSGTRQLSRQMPDSIRSESG